VLVVAESSTESTCSRLRISTESEAGVSPYLVLVRVGNWARFSATGCEIAAANDVAPAERRALVLRHDPPQHYRAGGLTRTSRLSATALDANTRGDNDAGSRRSRGLRTCCPDGCSAWAPDDCGQVWKAHDEMSQVRPTSHHISFTATPG
jgi:hypothetical protein